MRKTYVKPEIAFEDFSTSTNIASGCEGIVGNPSKGTCAVIGTGNIAMFDGSVPACVFTAEDSGDANDSFCYHVPTEYNNLFNS